jgi:3-methyladenine DNA glycosylase AlkD
MSPKLQDKLQQIRSFCQDHVDPLVAKKYARFFTEGYDAYGIEQKLMERQREFWLEQWKGELSFRNYLDLGELLLKDGKYEEASCAIIFASKFKEAFSQKTLPRFGGWLENGFRNWAHCDVFCGEVLQAFLIKKIVPLKAFAEWRTSPSKWKRRSVPVTLIYALKSGYPLPRLLPFIAPMMDDSERMVHQGLGWFLREAWKHDGPLTEKFLLKWKNTCNRRIVQYATEKMDARMKAKFKRSNRYA